MIRLVLFSGTTHFLQLALFIYLLFLWGNFLLMFITFMIPPLPCIFLSIIICHLLVIVPVEPLQLPSLILICIVYHVPNIV